MTSPTRTSKTTPMLFALYVTACMLLGLAASGQVLGAALVGLVVTASLIACRYLFSMAPRTS